MRKSVLSICMAILAACFIVICHMTFLPGSLRSNASRYPELETKKFAQPERPQHRDSLSMARDGYVEQQLPQPDWERRYLEIAQEPEWMQSQDELNELAGSLPEDQIRNALDQLASDQSSAAVCFGEALVRRWAITSLADATRWVEHLPDNSFAQAAFKEISISLADRDLAGAVDWVQQLPEGGNKTAAELSLANEAATRKEAVIAISLIANLPPNAERDGLLTYSVEQWSATDQEKAVAWVNEVSDAALREKMLAGIAIGLGVQDPFRAANFVASALPAGEVRNSIVVNIIRFWATSAPDQAIAWVKQFPDSPLRKTAMENLIDVWEKDDPSTANAWSGAVPQ